MDLLDILKITASVCLAALTLFLVPTLVQIRRTGKKAEKLLTSLDKEIPSLLKSLSSTATELEVLSLTINSKVEQTDNIIETTRYASETLLTTSKIVRDAVVPIAAQIGGLHAGITTFISFFKTNSRDPERRENEQR